MFEGASALGLPLTIEQADRLLAYLALIDKWRRVHNLTAITEPRAMLAQHLLDSLAIVRPLERVLADCAHVGAGRLLDVGSGAGLPGVVLAIMQPALEITCIDAVSKKARFVTQVAASLRLPNLRAVHGRVESAPEAGPDFDIVCSRAFASLQDFVQLTAQSLAPHGVWLAMKGRKPNAEIEALPPTVDVFHVEQIAVPGLDAERCVVWMRLKP